MKTTEQGGERGYDGGKHLTERKRHVGVETLGLLLAVVGTRAALDDAVAAPPVLVHLGPASYPRLEVVWADSKDHNHALHQWIATASSGQWRVEIVRRPQGAQGFVLLPTRWWWNAPSPGVAAVVATAGAMSAKPPPVKRGSASAPCT